MKKIFSVLMVVVLVLCLVSCEDTNKNIVKQEDSDIRIWTDTETGVQYVIYCHSGGYSGMGGITPRLNLDGTLYNSTEEGGEE